MREERVAVSGVARKDAVRLLFVGDIGLGGDYAARYGQGSPRWTEPFIDVAPMFQEADLRIGNLESPLFTSAYPRQKMNLLSAAPESIEALRCLGFDALNLANNHITDQGAEGITKTREILESNGISAFGAGDNLRTASKAVRLECRGRSFAFLGYAEEGRDVGAEMATDTREGCAPIVPERIEEDIAAVRLHADHVIVSLHWGYQYDSYPEPGQIRMARRVIDCGATIVHGHHPHVLQGMERYQNGLILYSLGNFFFSDFTRTDNWKVRFPRQSKNTAAVVCGVGPQGVLSVSMVPMALGPDLRMKILRGRPFTRAQMDFERLSSVLEAPDYTSQWNFSRRRTDKFRKKQDELMHVSGDATRFLGRVREKGIVGSLLGVRGRHLRALSELIRRYLCSIRGGFA